MRRTGRLFEERPSGKKRGGEALFWIQNRQRLAAASTAHLPQPDREQVSGLRLSLPAASLFTACSPAGNAEPPFIVRTAEKIQVRQDKTCGFIA